jgi:hypothetical protein
LPVSGSVIEQLGGRGIERRTSSQKLEAVSYNATKAAESRKFQGHTSNTMLLHPRMVCRKKTVLLAWLRWMREEQAAQEEHQSMLFVGK